MNRYVCIHGHFYQPPRENAWLEEIEMQDSAYPYHDWNERITTECYAPNSASRLLDPSGRIIDIVNNYSKISFNFGPTLLSWMRRHVPDTYEALIAADHESRKTFSGHGSAIAQIYNHVIMPLANTRDKRTQVLWGVRDFESRFGRRPEGIWLAETGVDLETLEILAREEILFTVLAPRQAGRVRAIGRRWRDASNGRVDPKMPYLCRLPSGRTITLFFYDGQISRDVAFGGLLNNGEALANRLLSGFSQDQAQSQLVHIATDGETYGHHHRNGDMALAYCLHHIESNNLARITVYGEYLELHPPTHEATIVENTSWSCGHGIERWRSDCGCNSGREGWRQEWRKPLRESLDWLRDNLAPLYQKEAGAVLTDPWRARDDYINVILDRSDENLDRFLSHHAARELAQEERIRTLRLLEMQRHAMLMYTSCGWFFDEVSGLETTQVLQYAARAIQLAEKATGTDLEPEFLERLRHAPSNLAENENGAQVYQRFVKPAMVDLLRVGAHYAVSSLFREYQQTEQIYCYSVSSEAYDRSAAGRQKLAVGRADMRSKITGDRRLVSFAVLHLGDHNLTGGVRDFESEESFSQMRSEIEEAFGRSDLPEIIRLMDKHFGTHNYSLWHLFRDEQRKVFGEILESTLDEVERSFRQIYDHHYPIMGVMKDLGNPIPKALATTAEFTINANLRKILSSPQIDMAQLRNLVEESRRWSFEIDRRTVEFLASNRITATLHDFAESPQDLARIEEANNLLGLLAPLHLNLDLWKAQNLHFALGRRLRGRMEDLAATADETAREWLTEFDSLGEHLRIRSA